MKTAFFALPLLLLVGGCSSNMYSAGSLGDPDSLKALEKANYTDLGKLIGQIDAVAVTKPAEAKILRNRHIENLLTISDMHYNDFIDRISTDDNIFNSSTETISIGLSAAAAVVGGPAAQALSVTDTGIKAAQGKINTRWFHDKAVSALRNVMDADRATLLNQIEGHLNDDYETYSMASAVNDLRTYHQIGNLYSAVAKLDVSTGVQVQQAKESLQNNRTIRQLKISKKK